MVNQETVGHQIWSIVPVLHEAQSNVEDTRSLFPSLLPARFSVDPHLVTMVLACPFFCIIKKPGKCNLCFHSKWKERGKYASYDEPSTPSPSSLLSKFLLRNSSFQISTFREPIPKRRNQHPIFCNSSSMHRFKKKETTV